MTSRNQPSSSETGAPAIPGGSSAFVEPLHVGRPNMGDRASFLDYANRIFDQKWLTNCGPLVLRFEDELARFLGVRHCLTVCNATIGLEIAIRALDLRGEVIVPSFTFVATAHALQWLGITPVFADIDPATHNLAPGAVEARITSRTTGILGVHLWGRPCEADALRSIARKHNLKLLFDAPTPSGTAIGGRGSETTAMPRCSVSTPPSSSTRSKAAPSPRTTRPWPGASA